MRTPPVEGSGARETALLDADQTTSDAPMPVTMAGTWNVCVAEPGITAEYIGEKTICRS